MKLSDVILAGILGVSIAQSLSAKDLFVPPAPIANPNLNATWPITPSGVARFGFGVPDDMKTFGSAHIVFVPTGTASGTYGLDLMVKRDSELSTPFDVISQANFPVVLNANQVTEVEVSSIFDGVFDATSAGNDYVSLILQTSQSLQSSARVLGLRFVYDPLPVPGTALGNNSVDSAKILNSSILSADVKNGTLTGLDMAPNTLSAVHLADEAGVDYAGGTQNLGLGPAPLFVRSIDVTAPANGHVIVTASGSFDLTLNAAEAQCGLRADAIPNMPADVVIGKLPVSFRTQSSAILPFTVTKGFPVQGGTTTTFRLVCRLAFPVGSVRNTNITAIFAPTRY